MAGSTKDEVEKLEHLARAVRDMGLVDVAQQIDQKVLRLRVGNLNVSMGIPTVSTASGSDFMKALRADFDQRVRKLNDKRLSDLGIGPTQRDLPLSDGDEQ